MKVLIVFAHPERESVNGSLLNVSIEELEKQGHEVKCSDLYRMNWKACVDRADFPNLEKDQRLRPAVASYMASNDNSLTDDVNEEQTKLKWADTVILQFPLWWFSMPAILKGWVERVFSCGFAYGVGEHSEKHWGDRYGEGMMLGKRAMLVVTAGGWPQHYSARGINGVIDDLLFPINHGILYYPGFTVLPSFLAYRVDRFDEDKFEKCADELRERLRTLETTEPIQYRPQNAGDYEIPSLELRRGLEEPGTTGLAIHTRPNTK